jgi:methylmalonyl-CoA/ethylmalonyl-CoA epimerase
LFREVFKDCVLKRPQIPDRLGKKAVSTGSKGDVFDKRIAAACKDDTDTGTGVAQLVKKFGPTAVREAHVDDYDRRAVDLQMPACGFKAIGPSQTCATVQAHQPQGVTGVEAVLDGKNRQAQQRPRDGWSAQVVEYIIINHVALHESLHFGAALANRALIRPKHLSAFMARGISRKHLGRRQDMIGRLNHVAIAVPDLEAASNQYRTALGAKVGAPQDEPDHGVTVVFIELPNTKIELLYPLGDNSPIAGFLEKNPSGGIHHVCYEVDDIIAARDHLKETGARVLGDGTPKIGAHGKPVLFLHPKDFNGCLVELEQV